MKNKPFSKRRLALAAAAILIFAAAVGAGVLADQIYNAQFKRTNSSEPLARKLSEFPGLQVAECSFVSNHGQKLAGYKYSKKGLRPRGVAVIAHGLGIGGQSVYMEVADYFTSHGYLVFAYDATAMDKSEGDSAIGMQQGVIDLSCAIDYVEHDAEMGRYPIVLFGHSWGAYCVSAVLNVHPEVKAVAAVSGFNDSISLFDWEMREKPQTKWLSMFLPSYFRLLEKAKFGKYAGYTAMSGFANTKAGIMVIHSRDDHNVPIEMGYDLYYARYRNDPRFRFRRYENRGHMFIFFKDAVNAYDRKFMPETAVEPTEFGKTHTFDKTKGYDIDPDFFGGILDFYNEYCGK